MMQDIDQKPKRAIVAAVQLSSVSDVEFEASLTELRQLAKRGSGPTPRRRARICVYG